MKIKKVMRKKLAQKCWEISLPNKFAHPITVYFIILEIIQNMMPNFGVSLVVIYLILLRKQKSGCQLSLTQNANYKWFFSNWYCTKTK